MANEKQNCADGSGHFVGLSPYIYQTFDTKKSIGLVNKNFCALAFFKKVIKATTLKNAQIEKIRPLYYNKYPPIRLKNLHYFFDLSAFRGRFA